jgi:transposase
MEMTGSIVGIDVSKDRLDVHVLPEGTALVAARDGQGLMELCERLRALQPTLVAIEATGGFESVATAALASAGLPVVVVNPAQVRHFAKTMGQRAKTDPIDAAVIARFAEATKPEVRTLPDKATRLLADLVARRRQIVDMMAAERQRRGRTTVRRLLRSIDRLLAALHKELSEIDAEIDTSVRGSPVWRETEDLLASVPGVGPVTARTLIAEMPGRDAGAGNARAQTDRGACRSCPLRAPIRPVEGQEHGRRRPQDGAHGAVHGRHRRRSI